MDEQLIALACDRFLALARRILRGMSEVGRTPAEDVLRPALTRLRRELAAAATTSRRQALDLVAESVRRELLALGTQLGAQPGEPDHRNDRTGPSDPTGEPYSLAEWADFHRAVEGLPDEERETFGLLWYGGLTQEEAAEVLGVSVRTVKRRWQTARLALEGGLDGGPA